MNDDYFQLPSSFIKSIEMIQDHNNRLNATFEPIRRQNAQMQTILEPIRRQNKLANAALYPLRAEVERINQIMSAAYSPMQAAITQYQELINNLTASIPNIDSYSNSLISSISPTINDLVVDESFPFIPSNECSKQEYVELVNQKIEDVIGSDIVSDIQKNYQESPNNILEDSDQSDVINNTVKHNDLRSDIVSKDWHQRMWIENIYGYVIQLICAYSMEYISSEAFKNAITNLINFLKSL